MAARESILCFCGRRPPPPLHRCARERRVGFFEEPVFDATAPRLELSHTSEGVLVAIPHLEPTTTQPQAEAALRRMVNRVLAELGDAPPVLWYCTPMAVGFTNHLKSSAIVYDRLEPERIAGALIERERWLLERADVVFTSRHGLHRFERRSPRRPSLRSRWSSVALAHFQRAREELLEPPDQDVIPHARVGYFGVIDERVDLQLLAKLAKARQDLHFVMLGPIVNLDPATLPQRANLHWLGAKPRALLPAYLAGWDVAMLPLVRHDATLLVSPIRTAEYLAAAKPVVATSIPELRECYGHDGLVWMGDNPGEFADAIDEALASDRYARVAHADAFLADHSWRPSWDEMWAFVERAIASREPSRGRRRAKPIDATHSVSVATVPR
jgi:glycosyltransferase involved in cell wall biosynthesis